MPSDNIFVLLGIFVSMIGIILYLFKDYKFINQYNDDEKAYNTACEKLCNVITNDNLSNNDTSVTLHTYLVTKLTLEGVEPWLSRGKSVRLFNAVKTFFIMSFCSIFLTSCVLCFIAEYYPGPSGIEMVDMILAVFLSYLIFVLFLCVVNAVYCKSLYTKRNNEELLTPTVEMLMHDKAVPDYGLVLLSKLCIPSKSKGNSEK